MRHASEFGEWRVVQRDQFGQLEPSTIQGFLEQTIIVGLHGFKCRPRAYSRPGSHALSGPWLILRAEQACVKVVNQLEFVDETAMTMVGHAKGIGMKCTVLHAMGLVLVGVVTSAFGLPRSNTLVFSSISAGRAHTCALASNKTAYCWGSGNVGQLGNGRTDHVSVPVAVSAPDGGRSLTFLSLAAGDGHTCGVASDGAAYCWGNGNSGQLGNGDTDFSSLPVLVSAPRNVQKLVFSSVVAGRAHTCGLTRDGTTYCWGYNGYLRHGGTPDYPTTPVMIDEALKFSSLSAGGFHTCGLTSSGKAYCWGDGSNGQLGNGDTPKLMSSPVAVTNPQNGPVLVFSSLSAGFRYTCGVTSNNATSGNGAYCWGYGDDGELGQGDTTNSLVPVAVSPPSKSRALEFSSLAAGITSTCGIASNDTAYCWGNGESGQLGQGETANSSVPVAVFAPKGAGGALKFSSLAVGGQHTCGLTLNGEAYCWGSGSAGQLGNGGMMDSSLPRLVDTINTRP
jgi:alpha-tubulin suppressor-like RCC1 family protein